MGDDRSLEVLMVAFKVKLSRVIKFICVVSDEFFIPILVAIRESITKHAPSSFCIDYSFYIQLNIK